MITEDGSIVAGADSYCTLTYADAYHEARGSANAAWSALSDTEKEAALIRATDYIELMWGGQFSGYRTSDLQDLSWPRTSAYNLNTRVEIAADAVPVLVRRACAELALRAIGAELSPDSGARVVKEKVDVIEVTYDTHAPNAPRYTAVEALLAPLLARATGGASVGLRRC